MGTLSSSIAWNALGWGREIGERALRRWVGCMSGVEEEMIGLGVVSDRPRPTTASSEVFRLWLLRRGTYA